MDDYFNLLVAAVIAAVFVGWLGFFRTVRATKCGHRTLVRGTIEAFGELKNYMLPVEEGVAEYCLDCLSAMTIRCAWCDQPIFIDDPVTLRDVSADWTLTSHAKLSLRDEHDQRGRYIGCFRRTCVRTIDHPDGYWLPPGVVHRIPVAAHIPRTRMKTS